MKRLFVFLFCLSCISVLVSSQQVVLQKPIVIRLSADKSLYLTKTESLMPELGVYKELPNQEWKILPSGEDSLFYLQTQDGYYLKLEKDSTSEVNTCSMTIAEPYSDEFKFRIVASGQGDWQISPKQDLNQYLQPYHNQNVIYAMPLSEFGTSAFTIDTVPYRRPKPTYTRFESLDCGLGILINEKPFPVFGGDATSYPANGMYPAQIIIRFFTNLGHTDRIELVIFDDIRQISRGRKYAITPKGNRTQPKVTIIKNNKAVAKVDDADCVLTMLNWSSGTIEFILQKGLMVGIDGTKKAEVIDLAYKGTIRMQ